MYTPKWTIVQPAQFGEAGEKLYAKRLAEWEKSTPIVHGSNR